MSERPRRDRSSPHPGVLDPAVVEPLTRVLRPIVRRFWPAELHGFERLPADGRFLIVANHSGMGAAELWCLLVGWYDRFGHARPLAGMAHPGAFRVPLLGDVLQGLGAVEATRDGARRAREREVPLLLFPGGDHEATRPLWHAERVDFAGRKGWIHLAREHRLSIVPMCITGSHVTLPILAHGRALSWLIGTRALGVRRAPLPALSPIVAAAVLAFARSLGASWPLGAVAAWASVWPTLMLPWIPSRIGFHVLPDIPLSDVDAGSDGAIYERVVSALQTTMTRVAKGASRACPDRQRAQPRPGTSPEFP